MDRSIFVVVFCLKICSSMQRKPIVGLKHYVRSPECFLMQWMAAFQNTLQTARSDAARGTADAVEDIDKLFQVNYCDDGATV